MAEATKTPAKAQPKPSAPPARIGERDLFGSLRTHEHKRGRRQACHTATDIHLPLRIGHAIVDAYKGDLDTHYDREGYFVRIRWSRED